ncbi:hypothetical protein CBR_g30152 [Chara braunii]|uniref:Sialidase domain-containing protein n=1 Tax=Chara braunii TaxID=69332 RepID=A0A388LC33_CHABU|nr:hypothetical protein CBR_g30152 [Chara braunii]|eukprot:GBG79887.1 hypothetical protein CBR_g30152 [Chara braunii]
MRTLIRKQRAHRRLDSMLFYSGAMLQLTDQHLRQVRWAQLNQPPSSASLPPLCMERKQSEGTLPRVEDTDMGVLMEEEKETEQQRRVMQEGKGACAAQEQMKSVPQLTWADKLRHPLQGQALTIQRGQGSPRTGKLEIPLDGLLQARAFFMTKFLLPSETKVVTQGGKQVMVKAYPDHGIASRDEIYTKHASNWVFHDDAAFKSVNDKARWIGRRLEILKNSAHLARDHFLVQPVTNNLFTVLALHEADKKVMDGWKRLRCERSEVRIHPWVPQRRLGPEEKRAQLMRDFHWVEFRHIPVEIQTAFVYDFGLLYDIVAFIDPLPSYVAKRDDYLMLALDFPPGQPFSLDDVIPPTVLPMGEEMEVAAGCKGPGEEVQLQEGGLQEDRMVEVDPFQPAFAPEPMEVDPLPENARAAPEGVPCEEGEEEGIPPQHLPVEQKLVEIADWLMTNLQAKYGPLTDFWDRTYRELFPMLDSSAALKGVLQNGLQSGIKWTEAWHRVASIVLARFQPPPAPHPAAAEETKVSNQTEGSILQSPVLPPGLAPSDLDEDAPLDLVRRKKLRHLIEMGQDTGPLSQEATLLLPVRKKNRKWEVGLTPVDHGKIKGVTLQGWSSFWAGHCKSEAAAGILRMQLDTHIAESMPPGAQATAPLEIEFKRAFQRDTLIRYDPDKDAGLRWLTLPQLLDMQAVKTRASESSRGAYGWKWVVQGIYKVGHLWDEIRRDWRRDEELLESLQGRMKRQQRLKELREAIPPHWIEMFTKDEITPGQWVKMKGDPRPASIYRVERVLDGRRLRVTCWRVDTGYEGLGEPLQEAEPGDGQKELQISTDGIETVSEAYKGQSSSEIRVVHSLDHGYNWTRPRPMFTEPGSFTKNQLLRSIRGEWLLPLYYTPGGAEAHSLQYSAIKRSKDGGFTWDEGTMMRGTKGKLVQPSVVRLRHDGILVAYFRSRGADYIYESRSFDDGYTWTKPRRTKLPNNNSGIQALVLSNGHLVIVFNNIRGPHGRWPLSIALSEDEGETWPFVRDLEPWVPDRGDQRLNEDFSLLDWDDDEPGVISAEYSYPSVVQSHVDDLLHISYTWRRKTIRHVRVTEDWIRRGSTVGEYQGGREMDDEAT